MGNCQFFNLKFPQPMAIEKNHPPNVSYSLIIKSVTWKKESYGLFDYENKNTTSSILKTTKPGLVKKLGEDVLLFNDHKFFENEINSPSQNNKELHSDKNGNQISTLVSISIKNNLFWIHNSNKKLAHYLSSSAGPSSKSLNESPKSSNLNQQKTQTNLLDNAGFYKQIIENGPWMVVRYFNENQGFQLSINDFIKLGRITFKVRSIFLNNKNINQVDLKTSKKNTFNEKQTLTDHDINDDDNETQVKQCRICLSDNNSSLQGSIKNCDFEKVKEKTIEDDNPFINPCKCSGTMKFIHLKCLQFWLASKIQIKQSSDCCKSLSWKNIECELCKFEFPMVMMHNKKECELIKIPKPEGSSNYVILDNLCKESNQTKGIHIINLDSKDTYKIGRGNENDLKISDISVSRTHAILKKKNNELYIEDSNSKFGTLVLMKRPYPLNNPNQMTAVQLGRIVLYFTLCTNNVSGFDLCCKKGIKKSDLNNKIEEELLSQDELVLENPKFEENKENLPEEIGNSHIENEISDHRSNEGNDEENINEDAHDVNESNQVNNETHQNISHNANI